MSSQLRLCSDRLGDPGRSVVRRASDSRQLQRTAVFCFAFAFPPTLGRVTLPKISPIGKRVLLAGL